MPASVGGEGCAGQGGGHDDSPKRRGNVSGGKEGGAAVTLRWAAAVME
jgi:hypothetical protein